MADTAWVIAKAVVSCGAGSCAKRNIWRKKGRAKGRESQYFSLIKRKLGNTFDIDQIPDNLYNSISLLSLQYSSFMAHCSCVSVGCCHYTYTHRDSPLSLPFSLVCLLLTPPLNFIDLQLVCSLGALHPKLFCLPTEGCPRCCCCCFRCSCCWTIQCVFYWSGARVCSLELIKRH